MIPHRLPDWQIEWLDFERVSTQAPKHQNGSDIDIAGDVRAACKSELPYPAPRIGRYFVRCRTCGKTAVVTTAGRVDDPRSLRMACRMNGAF